MQPRFRTAQIRSIRAKTWLAPVLPLLLLALLLPPRCVALAAETQEAAALYQKAKALKAEEKYEDALKYLQEALQARPDFEDAHFAMGVIYYKMHLPDRAIRAFQEVLRINPDSRETHNNLAVLYEHAGDYERAMEELQETVRLDPSYSRGRLNLAKLYFAKSVEEYFEVIRANGKEQTAEVRRKLHRILESDTQDADLQYNLGLLNRMEGNLKDAARNLRRSAELDPAYGTRAALELGDLLEKQGKLSDAFDAYQELLRRDPENFTAAYRAGLLKNGMKDYTTAEALLLRAGELRSDPAVNYQLGLARLRLGRRDEAIASFRAALEQADDPETRWALAGAYKENKDYAGALKEYEAILETYPDRDKVQKEILEITKVRLAQAVPAAAVSEGLKSGPANMAPASLVSLERDGDYALVVDKAAQTLLLYQNRKGRLTHVKTYACSTGANQGEKSRAGDRKTPEGIYLFTSVKTGGELPARYGSMAFPLDYPNFFDRSRNKHGNGIWLHSTNEPLRAFLPQKTRGCIVVSDADIRELAKRIRLRETPIIIHRKAPYVSPEEQDRLRGEILALLEAWRKSWEAEDLDRFLGFYARSFRHRAMDLAGWRAYKRRVFARTGRIRVAVTPQLILRHEDYLVVTFRQSYRADTHSDVGIKRLFLVREAGVWRIAGEEWRKI